MDKASSASVAEAILRGSGPPQVFTMTLSELRVVYQEIERNRQGTPVDILLNGDWAMVQFSRLSTHRIRVVEQHRGRLASGVGARKVLKEGDFEFASLHCRLYGARSPASLASLLKEEVSANWLALVPTFVVSCLAFSSLGSTQAGGTALGKICEVVLSAALLYLSVFVLFTVPGNARLMEDMYLFRSGLVHRYLRIDRLLARLAIVVLGLALLGIVLLNFPSPVTISVLATNISISHRSVAVPVLSALAVTILADCLLSLLYYFERARLLLEKNLTRELLDTLWEERNAEQESHDVGDDDGGR